MFSHIEKDHVEFLSNLKTLCPPKKRMDQFMTRAAGNFEMEVPFWEQVEKLKRQEKDTTDEIKWSEINIKLEKAEKDAAEIKKKIEDAEKNGT